MAQKRLWVDLMAAILKFKMAADRGRFLSGTRPEMNQYRKKYLCAKFGAFIPICTIFPLSAGLTVVNINLGLFRQILLQYSWEYKVWTSLIILH
jgi:hypothetical protein